MVCDDGCTTDPKEVRMASRLNPYLNFGGNAREAMEFYATVLGGELTLNTFGELGGPDAETPDNIMHGQLVSDRGYWLMGSDTAPGTEGTPENSAVSISGDDGDALRGYFEALSDGGQIAVPLEKQMWGDEFGMVTDRFGITWMVNIGQPGS
jgi:PhnB protein